MVSSNSEMSLKSRRKQLYAASIGNVMEFYDFVVYAYLAKILGGIFFPLEDVKSN